MNITKDFIFPYDTTLTIDLQKKKEAASILNQMYLVLQTMHAYLDHRRKILRQCPRKEN